MRLLPMGSKLLIEPQKRKEYKTEAGIDVINSDLSEGKIVEVSDDFKEIYKEGDIVLYSLGAGQGEYYQGKPCVWIDGRSVNNGGDVWSLILNDEAC